MKNNIVCVVDTETTGLTAFYHDVIQLTIMPLTTTFDRDNLRPAIDLRIKAKNPEQANPKALEINKLNPLEGLDWETEAKPQLCEWLQKNSIDKIYPLGQYVKFDLDMLNGLDQVFFDQVLQPRITRDTKQIAEYINDRKGCFKYGTSLVKLATHYEIDTTGAHDAFADCEMTRLVYKAMLQEKF